MLRIALLCAGGAALVVWPVLLAISVFYETSSGSTIATWLTVGMIASIIVTGFMLTAIGTKPGWLIGVGGAAIAIACAVAAVWVYRLMPEPNESTYISRQLALSALAFCFGVIGGGLIVLGEMATDGKVPQGAQRPDEPVTLRIAIVSVLILLVAAGASVPTVHAWTDDVNTDASRASATPPKSSELDLKESPSFTGEASSGLGTAGGLLTFDYGVGSPVSMTMHDAGTGKERWQYSSWNRELTGDPVLSSDGEIVALQTKRRDDGTYRSFVIDTVTGEPQFDSARDSYPGHLAAVTDGLTVYQSGETERTLKAFTRDGQEAWTYRAPEDCEVTNLVDDSKKLLAGMACRPESSKQYQSRVLAIDMKSGDVAWNWQAEGPGRISEHGMVVGPDMVVVDVRVDKDSGAGMFAARKYGHDMNALKMSDGSTMWRNAKVYQGATFAPACAGTLQIAGNDLETGRVVMGECHQVISSAGASFDVIAFALDDGKYQYKGKADLGYAPKRDADTSRWFVGLPDGRTVIAADASRDVNEPECHMNVAGPDKKSEQQELPTPEALEDTDWCRHASIYHTPNSLAVTYPGAEPAQGGFFAVG